MFLRPSLIFFLNLPAKFIFGLFLQFPDLLQGQSVPFVGPTPNLLMEGQQHFLVLLQNGVFHGRLNAEPLEMHADHLVAAHHRISLVNPGLGVQRPSAGLDT